MKILMLVSEHNFDVERRFYELYQELLEEHPDMKMSIWLDTRGTIEKEHHSSEGTQ